MPREPIALVLLLSVALTVFSVGARTQRNDGLFLLRHPWTLARSLLAMQVVMPLLAIGTAARFELDPALRVALVAISLSPVSPLAPLKELRGGGSGSYVVGLFAASALLAVVTVPLALDLIGRVLGTPLAISSSRIATIVGMTVLVPIILGVAARALSRDLADRIGRGASIVGLSVLVLCVIPMLISAGPSVVELVGDGTLAAITGYVAAGLVAGHLLGGPTRADRTVLALSTVSRHPGVAVAVASAAATEQRLVVAAVIHYLLVSSLATTGYLRWTVRRAPALPEPEGDGGRREGEETSDVGVGREGGGFRQVPPTMRSVRWPRNRRESGE